MPQRWMQVGRKLCEQYVIAANAVTVSMRPDSGEVIADCEDKLRRRLPWMKLIVHLQAPSAAILPRTTPDAHPVRKAARQHTISLPFICQLAFYTSWSEALHFSYFLCRHALPESAASRFPWFRLRNGAFTSISSPAAESRWKLRKIPYK